MYILPKITQSVLFDFEMRRILELKCFLFHVVEF